MAATNTSDQLYEIAMRKALHHLAEVNGITSFGPGWEPPRHTGDGANRGGTLFLANLAMASTAWVVVGGRVYARAFVVGAFGWDDYAILGALTTMTVSAFLSCWGVKKAGFGQHIFDLGILEIMPFLKLCFVLPIVYTLCILFIRLSILFFYRRLFGPNRNLQRIVSAFVWYEAIYTTVITLGCIFICNPVNSWWDLSRRADDCPTFRRTMGLYVGVRSLGVLEDVLILLLPMKFVFGLKLPLREKVGLCLIFSLGALFILQLDVSWNIYSISIFDRAEQCIGIIAASTPALTALLPRRFPEPPATPQTSEYELTPSITASPYSAHSHRGAFHFLKYAYDPDGVNMVYATAYATRPRGRLRVTGSRSTDLGERWLEPGTIAMTTTVEVKVNRR